MKGDKDDVLGKGFIPYMSKVFDFLNSDKFINKNIYKLEGLDVEEMRELLLKEVADAKALAPLECQQQLQKLFTKIFSFQPNFDEKKEREIKNTEQRLYADIIATPGFLDDEVVKDFVLNHFKINDKNLSKYVCLTQIIDMYDRLSLESKEKFDYCYRSSSKFAKALLYDNRYFNNLLNDRTLSMFNKETFSQIFRFSNDYHIETILSKYLFDNDDRAMFIISQMCEHIYNQVGHTSEFIQAVSSIVNTNFDDNFKKVLIDYYDQVIGSRDNEENFKAAIKEEIPYEMREMINAILDYSYDYSASNPFIGAESLSDFIKIVNKKRMDNHINVFGEKGFQKFVVDSFSESDFKEIKTKEDLLLLKGAILKNIYGISTRQAEHITLRYGHDIEVLDKTIIDSDRESLEVLKSITTISSLSLDNQDGIRLLQTAYLKYMQEKGLDYQKKCNSSVVLEGLFNRMFMNTYNMILYRDLSKERQFDIDDGVPLIDAGVDFSMIVTAINGTGKFFENGVNIANKWNTAFRDLGQGLCTSFISNENLGVISLNGPLLGFCNIPQDSLNTMGTTDIYTFTNNFNLRSNNHGDSAFVVGSEMSNETRYGYNEMLIDRFLATDTEGKVKLQPDYLVFYKTQDNYRMSKRYIETLKTAKDFGIPIVVIDYEKVQRHERETIKEMEDTLFKKEEVDKELLINIMTRYMNNISGNRTIHGSTRFGGLGIPKDVNFPEKDLGYFIDQVIARCESSKDELRREWIEALQEAYDKETRKHMQAISVRSYNCSIGNDNDSFNLITDYNLAERLITLHTKYDGQVKNDSSSFRIGEVPSEVSTLTSLANCLGFNTTYKVSKEINNQGNNGYSITKSDNSLEKVTLEEKLIVAYFTDNYSEDLISMLNNNSREEIRFGTLKEILFKRINKVPFVDRIEGSYLAKDVVNNGIDMDKINTYITKLEAIDDKKFINLFGAHIVKIANDNGYGYEYLADKFLEKKANIRSDFNKLNEVLTNTSSEDKKAK